MHKGDAATHKTTARDPMAERIRARLQERFAPAVLTVINESTQHAGHRASPETGQSHYAVRITQAALPGDTRVARHRAVMAACEAFFHEGLHALRIVMVP